MFLPDAASFVSSLFFAVHPIHTEAVCKIIKKIYKYLNYTYIFIIERHVNIIPRSQV